MIDKITKNFVKKAGRVVLDIMSGQVAIKTHNGTVSLGIEGGNHFIQENVVDLTMAFEAYAVRLPKGRIEAGDIIFQHNMPMFVTSVTKTEIHALDEAGTRMAITPTNSQFGGQGILVVKKISQGNNPLLTSMMLESLDEESKSLYFLAQAFGSAQTGGPLGDMLPLLLMSKGGDMKAMLPLLMMGGGFGGTEGAGGLGNMLPLLMLSKGGDMKSMLPLLMMRGGFGGTEGAGGLGNMLPLLLMDNADSSKLLPLIMMGAGTGMGQGFGPMFKTPEGGVATPEATKPSRGTTEASTS